MPFHHLIPTDETLFFSRNDPDDLRLGDLTTRDPGAFPGDAMVAIVGVPQDIGVQRNGGRPGASEAPDAIRRMLYRLTPFNPGTGRSIGRGRIRDLGNIDPAGDLEDIHERLNAVVTEICRAGVIPIVLGGGHDTTYGAATGVAAVHKTLGLINVDAHLDVRSPNPLRNSGTSFRMLIDEGCVRPESFVELGIQPYVNSEKHVQWVRDRGARIITLDEVHAYGARQQIEAALQIATAGVDALYGTLDIDGVRASEAPGVSAPLPDGLAAHELLEIATALGRCAKTVALDIVEVNPRFDRDNATARLAAHAIVRFIEGVVERRNLEVRI